MCRIVVDRASRDSAIYSRLTTRAECTRRGARVGKESPVTEREGERENRCITLLAHNGLTT